MRLTVDRIEPVAARIVEVTFVASDRGPLPTWNPGAHIELILSNALARQYSLCGHPNDDTEWKVAVLRESDGRGGSAYIHDELRPGDIVEVRGPRNNFRLLPGKTTRFIAGGIGITPMLPMIERCIERGWDWRLDYIGRSRSDMAYVERVLQGQNSRVHFTAETGRPDLAELVAGIAPVDLVYACGSESIMLALEQKLSGFAPETLRTEWFAPRPLVRADDALQEFDVVLERSGISLRVADGSSIVTAAAEAGVFIPTSCGEGTCGSCETFLLEGRPDHRDSVLDERERAEGGVVIPCVAGSRTKRLVLDA